MSKMDIAKAFLVSAFGGVATQMVNNAYADKNVWELGVVLLGGAATYCVAAAVTSNNGANIVTAEAAFAAGYIGAGLYMPDLAEMEIGRSSTQSAVEHVQVVDADYGRLKGPEFIVA